MNDLLKILDMSEDEQINWLMDKDYMPNYYVGMRGRKHDDSLADLAFRLRDEAKGHSWNGWLDATKEVWKTIHKYWTYEQFWMSQAKPIHWIIAALIAKEKKDE